jgi:hypothetical protein
MKFVSAVLATTALMGTSTMSAHPDMGDEYGNYGHHGHEVDLKLKGRFEAVAKLDLEGFVERVKAKHGHLFDRNCAEACYRTPGCRFDPHEHWSYCKYDHHPPTCFGLYHVPKHHGHHYEHGYGMEEGEDFTEWNWGKGHKFGRLCYQPSQPWCPEQFPVLCKAHRPHLKGKYMEDGLVGDLI